MGVINKIPNTTDESTWYVNEFGGSDMWRLKITANEGFKFIQDAQGTYTDTNGEQQTAEIYKNGAGYMVTADIAVGVSENTEITVTGSVVDETFLSITNEIPNTTATGKKTDYSSFTCTVTAKSGYKITGAKIRYNSDFGYPVSNDMVISPDGATATFTTSESEPDKPITITGTSVSQGEPELQVTNNITGEGLKEEHTYEKGTATFKVISEGQPRFRFIAPKVNYTGKDGGSKSVDMEQKTVEYHNEAFATVTDIDPTKPVTLTGSYEDVTHVEKNLSNCTDTPPLQDFYPKGVHLDITLQANEKTEFNPETPPKLSYSDVYGQPVIKTFNVTPDKKQAVLTFDLPTDYVTKSITINAEAFPVVVVGGSYGAINVYSVTLENLADFATKRFFTVVDKNPETGMDILKEVDLGVYVNRIRRLYANVPVGSTDVLRCGNYNTKIQVQQPEKDVLTLDFGNVTIPTPNKNSVDYDSEIQVFIPFGGFSSLPVDYVGKEINLTYIVNVVTGNGVAKLTCNGVTFHVEKVEPSQDIIYRTGNTELQLVGGDKWNELLFYGVEPYVLFKSFNSLNNTGNNDTYERGEISGFTGFNSFSNISTISAKEMLTSEQERIYNLLEQGVIIE